MYFRGQLVQRILAQMELPDRFFHNNKVNAAYNKLYDLMTSAKSSDRIQMECATSLITKLGTVESTKMELEVEIKKDEGGLALEAKMLELAELQVKGFKSGMDVKALQKITYIEGASDDIIDAEVE